MLFLLTQMPTPACSNHPSVQGTSEMLVIIGRFSSCHRSPLVLPLLPGYVFLFIYLF